jgi:predicted nucleotidyltransferase
MVKTEAEIRQMVKEYVNELESIIKVQKVILYGSYASGRPNEWSDVDIAIISSDFEGMNRLERQELLASKHLNCSPYLEPLGYSLKEYENAHPLTFLGEIKRTGKVIYEAK